MNNNEFQTVGLYNHNALSYQKIRQAFSSGKDVVGIVHATGTGKSYNALQLAYDNKDKKIVYVVPANGIIEHINKIILDNPNLNLKRDFSNLEFRTYHSFIPLDRKEIESISCDILVLDEFHHIGAPIWGERIKTMIKTHPKMKVFGMTAYTVRDRGTAYERDMANPDTEELFSGKIVSRYDLCDAMIDGVLPKPIYKTAYTNLIGMESKIEEKVQKLNATSKEYQEYMKILNDIKKRIHEAPSIPNILKKSIKPNGKYIYFCPPCVEEGTNDIATIKKQALLWFKQFVAEEDIVFYTSTSDMGEVGKKNRDAFYRDVNLDGEVVDNKLRVMFAINQYNEGIHAPNIDGVIMGRGTTSDIVYFEQLGRALAVRGNTKEMFDELENHSIIELREMCNARDIPIKENSTKEELIEKLIAPVVIDLTNNYEFIKQLENNLKDRIKSIQTSGLGDCREIKITDASFDIEIENQDLFEMLRYVMDRITMTWEDKYNLAKAYYEHYGNLEVPYKFKTINGYDFDENGIALGSWIWTQKRLYNGKEGHGIDENRARLLKKIGINFEMVDLWEERYDLAKKYYEHYGNLEIPSSFRTINGYDFDEKGIRLGTWLLGQRQAYAGKGTRNLLTEDKIEKLKQIGCVFDILDYRWLKMYNLAKAYYEHKGDIEIPAKFKTINGYDFDEAGVALGIWLQTQRGRYNDKLMTDERIKLLDDIGMRWAKLDKLPQWMEKYNLAKKYYEHHGNLEIPSSFKTINGYELDKSGVALGAWIADQRKSYRGKGKSILSDKQIKLLEEIGMMWFYDSLNEKLKQENISSENLETKKIEIQDRFYSVLNNYDSDSILTNKELNDKFLEQLNSRKK